MEKEQHFCFSSLSLHYLKRLLLADLCLSPPAAMGSSLPIMVMKRAGQIECKRVVNWSAVFQLVFQLKIKLDINVINQQFTKRIQLTPAHQTVV